MNDSHDGGLLGRITALALILGVAYGVRSIAHGGLGCPLGGCCLFSGRHSEESVQAAPAAGDSLSNPDAPKNIPAPAAPAK